MQECQQLPGMYVPQLGDRVYYIWQGHEAYLRSTSDAETVPQPSPWELLRSQVSHDGLFQTLEDFQHR